MRKKTELKGRIKYLDVLRGMAIVFMIIGHIGGQPYVDRYIHMFHMPVWFFISGWLYHNKHSSYRSIIEKKFRSLIIPYIFWGTFQYPLWVAFNINAKNKLQPLINLYWVNTSELMPIAGALWFLTSLFFAEIIFIVIDRNVSNKWLKTTLFICIAIFGNLYTNIINFRLPWAIDTSFVGAGFIYIGQLVRKYWNTETIQKIFNLPVWILTILFIVNGVLAFVNPYVNMRIGLYGFIPLFWINAITAIVIYWNISKKIEAGKHLYKFKNMIAQIGEDSIVYLCLNQLVILIIDKLLANVIFNCAWCVRVVVLLGLTLFILRIFDTIIMQTKFKVLFGKKV